MSLLQIENVSCHYGRIAAVRGVTLAVGEGEIVALIGANGAGKSTLLKGLSGVHGFSGGVVRLAGDEIARLSARARVKRGMVQVPEGRQLFADMSVRENVLLGAAARRGSDVAAEAARLMAMFPVLEERVDKPAGLLSGGEQQMVALVRAMMARPRLLLLDEPTMGLAPQLTTAVFDMIRRINAEGCAILLVEQNARAALSIASRAYVMEHGVITHEGDAASLREDRRIVEAYLGGAH
jgi:branched-chain amino acid transport system ATP-binding protein